MNFSKAKRYALAAAVACSLGAGGLLLRRGRGAALGPQGGERAASPSAPYKEHGLNAEQENEGVAPRKHAGAVRAAVFVEDGEAQAVANAKSVVEAAKTGKFPERLNPLVPARAFDKAAFERDPRAYLDVVEPGRVFQTAEGAEGVKMLESEGATYKEIDPEQSVELAVKGEPGAPVTFTSFDMGAFENKQASISVRAGADGVARVRFTATKGTVESIHIMAASPLTVGEVRFVVQVNRI